jgi:hypothetical protein
VGARDPVLILRIAEGHAADCARRREAIEKKGTKILGRAVTAWLQADGGRGGLECERLPEKPDREP